MKQNDINDDKVTRGDGAAGPKGPTRANAVPFPATLARGNPSRTPYHSFLISCFFPTVCVSPRAPLTTVFSFSISFPLFLFCHVSDHCSGLHDDESKV